MESMVMHIIELIISPLLALLIGIFFLGLARKVMARIQWRYGPPITQPLIDIIRLLSQKSANHGVVFNIGLIMSLAGSLTIVLFLPFGKIAPMSGSGGLLVILYLMLICPLGMAISSGESANPNASIGISRKLLLAMGYELPFLLVVLSIMTAYNTISLTEIVSLQRDTGWAIFSFPLVLSGIAYLLILPAILGFRPFELIHAPQEISSGPLVEYGGPYLALATLQHAFALFIGISLFVNLMLGGAANPVIFFLKMLVIFLLGLFVNAVFPRFRIDQAIRYLWRWPSLVAFAGLILVCVIGR